MIKRIVFCIALLFILFTPCVSALTVVSTTTVLWDPIQAVGGEKVEAIYVADPTICPHMQSDIIPNRIQMQQDFIRNADLFVAHNGSVDKEYVMPFIDDFMEANEYGSVEWKTLENPAMTWNSPTSAKELAREVAGWLTDADPDNKAYYETRLEDYLAEIESADLTDDERARISGQDVIVMVWQQDAAENWLGLNTVSIFAPEFYQGGKYTPVKIVDDIRENPEKYENVAYVIENMQSGEMAKGIHEYLITQADVSADRVIFTNFPKSIPGVDTLPDVLRYNKNLVMPAATVPDTTGTVPATPLATAIPVGTLVVIGSIGAVLLLYGRKN
jgi:zinc/manganese transport system substrate-binding protein